MNRKNPTDLQILQAVYDQHFDEYATFDVDNPSRGAKIHVPIEIRKIAETLNAEHDLVFGRLYYHLEHKYGYIQENGANVHFFANGLGSGEDREIHCVNFPYMASILAELQREHRTNRNNIIAAAVSALGAILSAIFAALALRV